MKYMYEDIYQKIIEGYKKPHRGVKGENEKNNAKEFKSKGSGERNTNNYVVSVRGGFGSGKSMNIVERFNNDDNFDSVVIEDHESLSLLANNHNFLKSISKSGAKAKFSNLINESAIFNWVYIITFFVTLSSILFPLVQTNIGVVSILWYLIFLIPIIMTLLKVFANVWKSMKNKVILIENIDRLEYKKIISIISKLRENSKIKSSLILVTFDTENLRDRYLEEYTVKTNSITNYIEKYFDSNFYLDPEIISNLSILDEAFASEDHYKKQVTNFVVKSKISNLRVIKKGILPLLDDELLKDIREYLSLDIGQYIYIQYLKETKYELFKYLMNNEDIFRADLGENHIYEPDYIYKILNNQYNEDEEINWKFISKIKHINNGWPEELDNIINNIDNKTGSRTNYMYRGNTQYKISDSYSFNYYFKNSDILKDINFLKEAAKYQGLMFMEFVNKKRPNAFIIEALIKSIKSNLKMSAVLNDDSLFEIMRGRKEWYWDKIVSEYILSFGIDNIADKLLNYIEDDNIDIALGMVSLLKDRITKEEFNKLDLTSKEILDGFSSEKMLLNQADICDLSISWRSRYGYIQKRKDAKEILYKYPELFQFTEGEINPREGELPIAKFIEVKTVSKILKNDTEVLKWLKQTKAPCFIGNGHEFIMRKELIDLIENPKD